MIARSTARIRAALHELRGLPTSSSAGMAALAALALITAALAGGVWGSIAAALGLLVVFAAVAAVAEPADRRFLLVAILSLLLVRYAVAMSFDMATFARTGGHVWAPDEGLYLRLAGQIVDSWRDPSSYVDWTDGNVQNQYVQTIARVFFVIGTNPAVIKVLNTTLAVLIAVLAYRTMVNLELRGRRWTVLLLLTFPSLVLWSSLALKDSYVWAFSTAIVWSSSEYIRSRNPWWHLVTLLLLLPIESVRRYIFVTMAIAWVFIVLAVRGRERIRAGAVTVSALAGIIVIVNPLSDLGVNPLYTPIVIRESAAIGGRTSFVEPPPVVRGRPGDRVVIQATDQTPPPNTTPREVIARPGDVIVFETTVSSGLTLPPRAIVVRPGDVVVFAPTVSPAPRSTAAAVVLNPQAVNRIGGPGSHETEDLSLQGTVSANLRHLPLGIAFVVGAPFPWMFETVADLTTIPEMLFWYATLVLAAIGGFRLVRDRDFRYAHGAAALVGIVLILALILGNVGTLIRSRDMATLFACVLAGVGAHEVITRWPRLVPGPVRRLLADGTA